MFKKDLPKEIPVFPLSNFILFPKTSVPLNIFEPRYLDMIEDSMETNQLIGMIQPKKFKNDEEVSIPKLYEIGCMGKIINHKKTDDGRLLIELKGIIRFQITKEINSNKKYRICQVDFKSYYDDLDNKQEEIRFKDLELIFKT